MLEELGEHQLRPIVESMAGEPVEEFSWQLDMRQLGAKGFYGYKLVPLFSYATSTGKAGGCRCCLKQVSPPESLHYAYLHRHGIPLCQVYGAIPLADDTEIIALEYLDRIGTRSFDDDGREWLLRVKAQINAVPIDARYREQLDELEKAREKKERPPSRQSYYDRLFDLAESGELGQEFQALCRGRRGAIQSLLDLAGEVEPQVAEIPLALCDQELDAGYRPGTDERRCFDLHGTRLLPRFADLRQIVGLPDGVRDGWGDAWHPRERWVSAYVDAYNSISEPPIREEDVVNGARILWMQHALDPGWSNWFVDRALSGEDGIRDCLLSVMAYLLRIV